MKLFLTNDDGVEAEGIHVPVIKSDYGICKKGYVSVSRICAEPRPCNDVDGITFSL